MPTDNTQEGVERVEDWPVFCVARSRHWRSFQLDPVQDAAKIARYRADYPVHEVETYHPASALNVLSQEEAQLLSRFFTSFSDDFSTAEKRALDRIVERLGTYAKDPKGADDGIS